MFQDLRYGLRLLRSQPLFTLVAALTLALGIGANTAIFSVINALMLRPLPFARAEQLVWVEQVSQALPLTRVWGAHFLDWREQGRSLEAIAAHDARELALTDAGEPERIACGEATANLFPLLGVGPFAKGRNFTAAEDQPGGGHVAILSHALWQRRYGGDPDIVGEKITLDETSHTVIGVLPADFRYFRPYELWVPLALDAQAERDNERRRMMEVVARLKPGLHSNRRARNWR